MTIRFRTTRLHNMSLYTPQPLLIHPPTPHPPQGPLSAELSFMTVPLGRPLSYWGRCHRCHYARWISNWSFKSFWLYFEWLRPRTGFGTWWFAAAATVAIMWSNGQAVVKRMCTNDTRVVIDCMCHLGLCHRGPGAEFAKLYITPPKRFQLIPMKKIRPQDRISVSIRVVTVQAVSLPHSLTVPFLCLLFPFPIPCRNPEVIAIGVKCRTLKNVTQNRFSASQVD